MYDLELTDHHTRHHSVQKYCLMSSTSTKCSYTKWIWTGFVTESNWTHQFQSDAPMQHNRSQTSRRKDHARFSQGFYFCTFSVLMSHDTCANCQLLVAPICDFSLFLICQSALERFCKAPIGQSATAKPTRAMLEECRGRPRARRSNSSSF